MGEEEGERGDEEGKRESQENWENGRIPENKNKEGI